MNKRIKRTGLILLILGLAGWGIYAFVSPDKKSSEPTGAKSKATASTSRNNRLLNVDGLIIRPQHLTDELVITGNLLPDEEVNLSFETSGKITEINFNEGTFVKKGELLAKVNDRPLQAQLKKLNAQLKLAEDRVFRQNALLVKDAVSKEAYEQVKTDLAALNADIDLIKANIQQTEIRAPFDGVIGLRQVSVGAYASPTTVVAKLTKVSPLKVEFSVPERYAQEIERGTKLTFFLESANSAISEHNATVYAKASQVDQVSRTLAVRASYPNHGNRLVPGRYISIKLKKTEIPDAIAVPTEAIVPEMGKDKVYVYRNGKAYPVEVISGLRTDAHLEILEGLHVGDTIITTGTLQLRTGIDVKLDKIH